MKEILLVIGGVIVILAVLFYFITRDTTSTLSDSSYGQICLNGVVYWRGHQTLAVKYNRDGTVDLCK
jgi:hypothetical protein